MLAQRRWICLTSRSYLPALRQFFLTDSAKENPRYYPVSSNSSTRVTTILACWTTSAETLGNWRTPRTRKMVVADLANLQSIFLLWAVTYSETPSSTALLRSTAWRSWSALLFGNKVFNPESRSTWSYDQLGMRMRTRRTRNRGFALITLLWSSGVARLSRGAEPCRWRWRMGANCFSICLWLCAIISMTLSRLGEHNFLTYLLTF